MGVHYEVKPAKLTPAPNAKTGGKLYMELLKVMKFGPQPEQPEDEGFFEVATYSSRSSAASTVTNIKNGKRKIPAGRWIFTSRGHVDTNSSVLLVKYLGPKEDLT